MRNKLSRISFVIFQRGQSILLVLESSLIQCEKKNTKNLSRHEVDPSIRL